jgi:hypothetical protein
VSLTLHSIVEYSGGAGSRPGGRVPFGGRQKEPKTSLNVHAHRGMHKHSTRCVHRRPTTPEMLLHPCTCVETGVHGALCMAEARASISELTWHSPVRRFADMPRPRPVPVPVPVPVRVRVRVRVRSRALRLFRVLRGPGHGARARMEQYFWCGRPAVNTPCRMPLHRTVSMNVQKTFLVPFGVHQKGLACRGETRPLASTRQSNAGLGHSA